MSAIRSKNTNPEVRLRSALFQRGLRYRLHVKNLPGRPDLVFPRYKVVLHVRGCFWHQHSCSSGHIPMSRVAYWGPKLKRNVQRDKEVDTALRAMGWRILVVWECSIRSEKKLQKMSDRVVRKITKSIRQKRRKN